MLWCQLWQREEAEKGNDMELKLVKILLQHGLFPGCLQPQYYIRQQQVNFGDRTRSGEAAVYGRS